MRTKILGIIFIIIFFVQSIIYSFSYLTLINNKIINFPGIIAVQKDIYFKGYRKLWQEKKECIDFSLDLIYVPSFKTCLFENPEFKTVLNFNEYGRKNENYLKENNIYDKGIAVLGDSEAMGWRVNNNQIFKRIKMTQKLKILFDLDGILINTAPGLMRTRNYVMKKYGYSERKLSNIKKQAGAPNSLFYD